jgi:hypothetical protein
VLDIARAARSKAKPSREKLKPRLWTITQFDDDPARNMARFYAMDVQSDLFGAILLVRQMGTHRHLRARPTAALRPRLLCWSARPSANATAVTAEVPWIPIP